MPAAQRCGALWRTARAAGCSVPGLSGTGRLADDLYLLAHHEQTGVPHLQPRALGVGLAGGLLAELMLSGSVRLWRGVVMPAGGNPPADGLARSVLGAVAGEREHLPVRDWLLFLARSAAGDVAGRLAADGYLTRAGGRRRWRGGRWVPVDADTAFAPLVRVKSALRTAGPLPTQNAALGGLATACGLGHQLALWLPADAGRRLQEAVRDLHPWLRELIAATEATVGAAVLSHRA
jgi:hypothetical protein